MCLIITVMIKALHQNPDTSIAHSSYVTECLELEIVEVVYLINTAIQITLGRQTDRCMIGLLTRSLTCAYTCS